MDAATMVKRLRAFGGVTRKELAGLAGLAPSTIGRIEQGALDPTWGTLSRILDATGYQINGETVVSVGDSTAISAARPVLEPLLARRDATTPDIVSASKAETIEPSPEAIGRWLDRWTRAGWLSSRADVDDMVNVAISAGNAGKIARRSVSRRNVAATDGWRALARRLGEAGIDYAVSGLVTVRGDRATATAASPVFYVENPVLVMANLGLEDAAPGRGVLLIAPESDELASTETDGGIRFVSRAQGILDAFAGSGREPDKAENALRSLLARGA